MSPRTVARASRWPGGGRPEGDLDFLYHLTSGLFWVGVGMLSPFLSHRLLVSRKTKLFSFDICLNVYF